MSDNPFERWDLDPLAGPQAITEALRERVEDATDEHERAAIREDWEALTLMSYQSDVCDAGSVRLRVLSTRRLPVVTGEGMRDEFLGLLLVFAVV